MTESNSSRILKNYVNGRWCEPSVDEFLDVCNPSNGQILAKVPMSGEAEVNHAVSTARTAFDLWRRTPVAQRCAPVRRLAELLRENFEVLSRQITEEMGKSLPDARAEMKRTIENVDVACGMPTLMQGENVTNCAAGIDGEVLRLPIGVFGMIAPFNFPAMVPFWFLPYAIAAGNTVVLKCSEQVPSTMQAHFELIDQCGFPPGVINLVNGDKQASQALVQHSDVDGISFVGSTVVARQIAEMCARTGKRCQAFGSAKNYLVVMPDAKLDHVVQNMLTSCLGCAGQRCMAASAIACVGEKTYRQVCEQFTAAAAKATVGNPLDPDLTDEELVIGPVISAAAKQRIEGLIQAGVDEGATLLVDGRGAEISGCDRGHFIGPTVLADVRPGSILERTEIFGPVVILLRFDSLDDALATINRHEFGNGASIYTQNGYWARQFKTETQAGMIGINVGIPAPVACLPFGGMKGSIFADIKGQSSHCRRRGKPALNYDSVAMNATELPTTN
ncbi:MAG: CoA-acylating methylmalonate-semialdehyde dehydrogenase [Pirellulaceae bacterium]|nr:CoA-acylating methylmalonate-semialdehyde dehydrogenase [Pirellulaceae bacterium]